MSTASKRYTNKRVHEIRSELFKAFPPGVTFTTEEVHRLGISNDKKGPMKSLMNLKTSLVMDRNSTRLKRISTHEWQFTTHNKCN